MTASAASGWIEGTVVPGDGRGRALGFPTANLRLLREEARPPDGIYACWACIEEETAPQPGLLHAGPRPTFSDHRRTVELHLLDATADFLGKRIAVQCVTRLRDVERFPSAAALAAAMEEDRARARDILDRASPP